MSSDASGGPSPGTRKVPRERSLGSDISPALEERIVQAAREIRAAHDTELSDTRKAHRAGRLFWKLIREKESATTSIPGVPEDASADIDRLADGLGDLLSGAIRTGTGLLQGPVTALAQALMAGVAGSSGRPPADPGATTVPQITPATAEERMVVEALRQYMPFLTSAVRKKSGGYGLAATVIGFGGRSVYDQLSAPGAGRIMELVRGEPDLWEQVAPIEEPFFELLKEFVDYKNQPGPSEE